MPFKRSSGAFPISAHLNTAAIDARLIALTDWLHRTLPDVRRVDVASADASFRRYFRVWQDGKTFIAMDAPPDKEDVGPFLRIARQLHEIGVNAPRVLAEDRESGFLLLTDLGSTPYLGELQADRQVEQLYGDALGALCRIQARGDAHAAQLPPYDEAVLTREMQLMPQWFCGVHLGLTLSAGEETLLARYFALLSREALGQPQVFVHRDYHSRNLMVCSQDNPGILDFQDALRGAMTYDLVSLLKDCYIRWPRARVLGWVQAYRAMAIDAGLSAGADEAQFVRWFDFMGLQRHIKVLGIFARLYHRDGKAGYLKDLPLTFDYVREVCREYPELVELGGFLESRLLPVFENVSGAAS